MKPFQSLTRSFRMFIVGGMSFSLLAQSCVAQGFQFNGHVPGIPGNLHIFVPQKTIEELFKSPKLRFQESVLQGDTDRARRWVQPEYVDATIKGLPPIYYAAAQGNAAMVKLLATNGASVKRRFNEKSLAYVAASFGYPKTGTVLVSLGGGTDADISAGVRLFAENQKRREQQNRMIAFAAFAILAKMISSSSGGSNSGDDSADRDKEARDNYYLDQQKKDYERQQAQAEAERAETAASWERMSQTHTAGY